MVNLFPNLETFLSETQGQPQVAETKQEKGSVIIKLKNAASENDPFIVSVADLAEKLNLKRYIKARYQEVEVDPIQRFIEKMAPFCVGEPQIGDKEKVLFLKPEVIKDYAKFAEIRLEARKIGAVLITHPRAGLAIPNNLPKTEKTTDVAIAAFAVDLLALHATRLRYYYHKDMTVADAAESIKFLLGCGWTEEKICELGVSRASFFRLRKS